MTVSKIKPLKCNDKAIINLHYKKWSNILQRYMICSSSRKADFDSAYRLFCEEVTTTNRRKQQQTPKSKEFAVKVY